MDLFETFYGAGSTFDECLQNGPGAVREALAGCSEDEIKGLAKWLGVKQDQTIEAIVARVVSITCRSRGFGDY